MITFDKITIMTSCPLCGVAKECDVFVEDNHNGVWATKFYCGNVAEPFQGEVRMETQMCRIIQQMRGTKTVKPDGELVPLLDLPLQRKMVLPELLSH